MSEMQVSVENVGRLNRRLSVIVPISQLEQNKKQRLAELAKKTRLDGFRPGKIPVTVIEKLYGKSLWGEVIQESVQTSLSVALEKNALNPAGQPHIDSIKAELGSDLEYTASFEVYPQVLVSELKDIYLEKLNVDITEADIDLVLEKIRHQQADWVEVERKAQYGDKVIFDLLFSEGEPRKDLEWILEEEKIPEGFSKLLGSGSGETLSVSLPTNEGEPGQTFPTHVQVKTITEPKLPDLDDAFAKRLGVVEGGVDTLRVKVHQHMQDELNRILREKLKTQVIDKLLAAHVIEELPQVLLDREIQRLEVEWRKQEKKDSQESLPEAIKKDLLFTAHRHVALGVVFSAVVEKYHLEVDEARVHQEIERLASAFQFDQAMRDRIYYKDKNMMSGIRSFILEEQVIDKLLEEVNYTEKKAEYMEMMDSVKK